jgi:hypothetical protein
MPSRIQSSILSVLLTTALAVFLPACSDDPVEPTDTAPPPLSFATFADADWVVGQDDMTSGAVNKGVGVSASGLAFPFGTVAGDNNTFYIPDRDNNRILGYTSIPMGNGNAASFLVGQSGYTVNAPGLSAKQFNGPNDCAVSNGKLFVADVGNRRVLIWNSLPTSNVDADVVVGQLNMTSNTSATSQSQFSYPIRVAVAGGKLFVADFSGNRILIWNSIPTTNGAPANVVLGQTDFTSTGAGLSDTKFGTPNGMWTNGKKLVISDSDNDRVLIWNSIPTSNGKAANLVVGAPDFTTVGSNVASATSIGVPAGIASDGQTLFVVDQGFHRVLIYAFPTSSYPAAKGVLGQSDFVHSANNDSDQNGVGDGPSAHSFSFPSSARIIGRQLILSDFGNSRVLIFNSQ